MQGEVKQARKGVAQLVFSGFADSYIYTFGSGFLVYDHAFTVCNLAQEPDYLRIVAHKVYDMTSPGHFKTFPDVSDRP